MDKNKYSYLFINNLTLKLIAIILMSLSHIGLFLEYSNLNLTLSNIFKYIGSIAFPLIVFLEIEALNKTKSIKKYFIRLFVMSLFIFSFILILSFIPSLESLNIYKFGNIFIDLILFLLIYVIINSKNKSNYIYLIFIILFYLFNYLIKLNYLSIDNTIYKIIGGIFPQYSLFGLILFLTSLILFKLFDKKIKESDESLLNTSKYYLYKNIIYILILALFSIIFYILTYFNDYLGVDSVTESYIVLGAIFIIFYNYKLGKSNLIIKYSFYIYYPLHLIIIFIIFKALNLI